MNRFQQASDQWNREVDDIAADLIEAGQPPQAALVEACRRVEARRKAKTIHDANQILEKIGRQISVE